jgi:hypothetical protein
VGYGKYGVAESRYEESLTQSRKDAKSKNLKDLIFKFHMDIHQRRKYEGKYLLQKSE